MTIEKNYSFGGQKRKTEAEDSEITITNKLAILLSLASSSTTQEYHKSYKITACKGKLIKIDYYYYFFLNYWEC